MLVNAAKSGATNAINITKVNTLGAIKYEQRQTQGTQATPKRL